MPRELVDAFAGVVVFTALWSFVFAPVAWSTSRRFPYLIATVVDDELPARPAPAGRGSSRPWYDPRE